ELSAFRIVQEALTNTLKHGGAGVSAVVAVRRGPSALELSVLDDGVGERQPVPAGAGGGGGAGEAGGAGQGLGLVGMRERVALHGGELRTGRRPGGGYEVRAWFPLPV